MRSILSRLGLVVFLATLLAEAPKLRAGEVEFMEVVATGVGRNSDAALQNALRAAVRQAVGAMVNANTLIANDEVVHDRILTHSAGFVASHEPIGNARDLGDGLVEVTIRANVRRTTLAGALGAESIPVTAAMDGESLFGEVLTKLDERASGKEMLLAALEGFPASVMEARLASPPSFDADAGKVVLSAEVSVNREKYAAFAKNLSSVLEQVGRKAAVMNRRLKSRRQDYLVDDIPDGKPPGWGLYGPHFVICVNMNTGRTAAAWEIFEIPLEIWEAAFLQLISSDNLVDAAYRPLSLKLQMNVVDNEGGLLGFANLNVPSTFGVVRRIVYIFPVLSRTDYDSSRFEPGTYSSVFNIYLDMDPEDARNAKNVEFSFTAR